MSGAAPFSSSSSMDFDRWWRGAKTWPAVKPMAKKEIEEGLREISRHVANVRIEAHLGRSQVNAAKALSQYIQQGRLYDLQDVHRVSAPITAMRGKILGFGAYGAVVEFLHSSPASDRSSPPSLSSSLSSKRQSTVHSSSQQRESETAKKPRAGASEGDLSPSLLSEKEQREREKREGEAQEQGEGTVFKGGHTEGEEETKQQDGGNPPEEKEDRTSLSSSEKKPPSPSNASPASSPPPPGVLSASLAKRRNSFSHPAEDRNGAGVQASRRALSSSSFSSSSFSSSSSSLQGKSVSVGGVRYAAKIFHWSKKRHPKMEEVEKTFDAYIEEELDAFKLLRRIPKRSLSERKRSRRKTETPETHQGEEAAGEEQEEDDTENLDEGAMKKKKKRVLTKKEEAEEAREEEEGVISDEELFLKYGLVVPIEGVREIAGLPSIFQANPALYPGDVPLFFSNRLIVYPALKCSLDMLLQSSNLGGSSFFHSFSRDSKRVLLRQIVSLVAGLHGLGFTHDDIKPQNFLVSLKGELYLGDFAYLIPIDTVQDCNKGFTIDYTPPELMECALKNASLPMSTYRDSWAVGVSGYQILCRNFLPFFLDKKFGAKAEPKQVASYIASLQEKDLETSRCGGDYDKEAMSFVLRLLQPNKEKRATVEDLMNEPFFALPDEEEDPEEPWEKEDLSEEQQEHDQV